MKRFMLVLVSALLIGALSGCMWNPAGDDTGSITLDFSSFAGALSASTTGSTTVNAARVWLFRGEDRYLLAPTTAYAQVDFASNTGLVTLGGIPEGSGYQMQVVLGHLGGGENGANAWFQPISFGDSRVFEISGGRETPVTINVATVASAFTGGITFGQNGRNVVSTAYSREYSTVGIAFSDDPGSVFGTAVTETAVPAPATSEAVPLTSFVSTATKLHSVAVGPIGNTDGVFLSTDVGLFEVETSAVGATQPSVLRETGVLSAGSFIAGDDTVIFYQRPGGFGWASFAGTPQASDWSDTDLSDIVGDESPVYDFDVQIAGDNESGRAAFITRLGNFVVDESFFDSEDQEVNVVDLLTGNSQATGLTTFGVYYPETTSRLQLRHVALMGNRVVVGAPRGAFWFPVSQLSSLADGYVSENVRALAAVRNRFVVDMAASGNYLAVMTRRTLAVYEFTNNAFVERHVVPANAAVMGVPRSISFAATDAGTYLLVGGSEGLTSIKLATN